MDLLRRELRPFARKAPGVLVGPAAGEDAAVIRPSPGRVLVATADPITLAEKELGRYLVQVNANDIAVMGAVPRWLLVTLLLPEGRTAARRYARIMEEIRVTCASLGISVVGGHSEVSVDLPRPIACACLLGEARPAELLDKRSIRAGDLLYLTRPVAIEGTAALATDCADALRKRGLGMQLLRRARRLLREPGISVVGDAGIAARVAGVRALHDVTEGGVSGGAVELAERAGLGLRLERDAVQVLPETRGICKALGLDPLALLASGALLIAVAPRGAQSLERAFRDQDADPVPVGEFLPARSGRWSAGTGRRRKLVAPARDELARALEILQTTSG